MSVQLETRTYISRSKMQQMRELGKVPGIIYSSKGDNAMFFIEDKALISEMNKGNFYHRVLSCDLNGETITVMAKDIHSHVRTDNIIHVDLKQVTPETTVHVKVPVKVINTDKNFDMEHGAELEYTQHFIPVKCACADIPAYISLDVSNMKLHDTVKAGDLSLPKNVELDTSADTVIISITGKVRVL